MGSSMKKSVFPESVVQGLKRWRGRVRKNLRSNYSARPSLDTSLSLDTSPSFTLDASYSVDCEPPSDDTEYVAVEIGEEKVDKQIDQEHQKVNSFDGFDVSNTALIYEEAK